MFPLCRTKHKYWEMNAVHSSLNEFIDPLGSLWNQARAGLFRLTGNTLHKRRSFLAALRTWWRAPLTDRLDQRGGLFLDSAFALFWGGERSRSGELL